MSSEVKVPTLGESISEATIGEWLKQPGLHRRYIPRRLPLRTSRERLPDTAWCDKR